MTSGVDKCVDIELFDEEQQWTTYRAITNIRVVKAKENFRCVIGPQQQRVR
jgi:hypothetical protein